MLSLTMPEASRRGVFRAFFRLPRGLRCSAGAALVLLLAANPTATRSQQTAADARGLAPILNYIGSGWDTLTRSMSDCKSVVDPKLAAASVLYLPAGFDEPTSVQQLQKQCGVQVKHLSQVIHRLGEMDSGQVDPEGL